MWQLSLFKRKIESALNCFRSVKSLNFCWFKLIMQHKNPEERFVYKLVMFVVDKLCENWMRVTHMKQIF